MYPYWWSTPQSLPRKPIMTLWILIPDPCCHGFGCLSCISGVNGVGRNLYAFGRFTSSPLLSVHSSFPKVEVYRVSPYLPPSYTGHSVTSGPSLPLLPQPYYSSLTGEGIGLPLSLHIRTGYSPLRVVVQVRVRRIFACVLFSNDHLNG